MYLTKDTIKAIKFIYEAGEAARRVGERTLVLCTPWVPEQPYPYPHNSKKA
jgi:hypothetical protein